MSSSPAIDPAFSAIEQFIADNQLARDSKHPPGPHTLALQIAHNLRFQHNWHDVRLHYNVRNEGTALALPRPVISGLPADRLYVHPDEQLEVLQQQRRDGKAGWPDMGKEREWVLPSHLHEQWTMRRFAEVFDALPPVPLKHGGGPLFREVEMSEDGPTRVPTALESTGEAGASRASGAVADGTGVEREEPPNPWRMRQPKRMLLATQSDDSTVVYYIVHDGLAKPRQN